MGALYKKDIIAPDTFKKNGANFAIAEFLDIDLTQLAAVTFTDLFG